MKYKVELRAMDGGSWYLRASTIEATRDAELATEFESEDEARSMRDSLNDVWRSRAQIVECP